MNVNDMMNDSKIPALLEEIYNKLDSETDISREIDDYPNETKIPKLLQHIADKLNGGSSGGEGLVVTCAFNSETKEGTLDKTWREIYDAMKAGTPVTIGWEEGSDDWFITSCINCSYDGSQYNLDIFLNFTDSSTVFSFLAETEDDYPIVNLN